jgi:lysophospholipase L1-like esterase
MQNKLALLAAAAAASRSYRNRVLSMSGLIGFWEFPDTGSTFADSTGNAFTGTFSGTISAKNQPWAGGRYATFAQGFGSVYSAGFLTAFDPNEFTLNLYVRPTTAWTTAANQYLAHFYVDASNFFRIYLASAGYISVGWYGGGTANSVNQGCTVLPVTDFQMLTVTGSKSANSLRLMINGEDNVFMRTTMAGTWAGSPTSTQCGFGGFRNNTHVFGLFGDLSNVALFDQALSEADVRKLMLRPLPVLSVLGDSIAQYTSLRNWVQGVAQTRGWRVVNHGYSGSSIMGASHGQTQQTTEAENDGASYIILQHGVNDADNAGITATYAANIAALKLSNPAATIYGMGILPNTGATAAYRDTNNGRIEVACAAQGIAYWNTDGWIVPATDTSDGLHPNDTGAAKIMAEILTRL